MKNEMEVDNIKSSLGSPRESACTVGADSLSGDSPHPRG